jgi:hypothetical protein
MIRAPRRVTATSRLRTSASALALLIAATWFSLTMSTAAQESEGLGSVRDRERPAYEPQGWLVGGFVLHSSFDLSAEATDNVLATDTAEENDIIYRIAPQLRFESGWERHALNFRAGAEFLSYQETTDANAETGFLEAKGRLDLYRESYLGFDAGLARVAEPFTDPDALAGPEHVIYDREMFGLSAGHTFNRLRLSARVAAAGYDFDDANGIDQDRRDRDDQSVTARAEWAILPDVYAVGQATFDERNYSGDPALNSEGQTYLVGVRIERPDLMKGELTIGAFERGYDLSAADIDGFAVQGNVEWYVTRLTTVTVAASREAREGGATISNPYSAEQYSARIDHELLRNVILWSAARWETREYETIDRNDDNFAAEVGVDYLLNRNVALRGRYLHHENSSSGALAGREFDLNALLAGVSFRL